MGGHMAMTILKDFLKLPKNDINLGILQQFATFPALTRTIGHFILVEQQF